MSRIVVPLSISLDGYFEGPDQDISWHQVDAELHHYINAQLAPFAAFWSGRTTWQLMADFWPAADQDPDAPQEYVEFAKIWRDKPKIVFSTTLADAGWNTSILRSVDPDEIRRLRDSTDGLITLGGPDLVETFLEHDLVDEFWLYVNPVVLGAGSRVFSQGRRIALTLTESRHFGNGVNLLRYSVVRDGS